MFTRSLSPLRVLAITKEKCAWLLAAVLVLGLQTARAQVEYVDPTIGGQGFLLEPTRPSVSIPNSMVRVYPVRHDQLDDQISSFPLTIISHRLGELFWLLPSVGPVDSGAWKRPAAYDQEITTPYYYSTRFDGSLIRTEFTPTERCGFFRFTFPSGTPTVLLGNRLEGELADAGNNSVSGVERFHDMAAYFFGEFSAPVEIQSRDGNRHLAATATGGGKVLQFRYGISFIGVDQARKNLRRELPSWDFEKVKSNARDRWNKTLGRLKVEGGTLEQKRVFYTAFYRCSERMVNITEDGQYYSGFDHQVHQDTRPFYVDNWLWDTYRALEPLHILLNPGMEADKLESFVRMYQQCGWFPCFALLWGNWPAMTGNPGAPWMADAWAKGVTNFDLATAYAGLRKNSLEGTWIPWRRGPRTSIDDYFAEHGYMPALHLDEKETVPQVDSFERRQAVSVTLAQSYDDWCAAQLARTLGKEEDYQLFSKRSHNYTNVFRVDKNFMWPKDSAGNWIEPFDPGFTGGRAYMTENNGYTFDWDVPHDLPGLFELMGGRAKAEAKLDQLFRQGLGHSKYEFWAKYPDASGLVGQFSMGNEPSFNIPYLYNRLGAPWKTQKRVRMLLETWFTDTLLGMPGDEDGGGMSAFVVFSMMGLYPVIAGVPVYDLTSPVFDRITIELPSGKQLRIICKNNSRENKYIQSIQFNGKPLPRVWLTHGEITNGGTLELKMVNIPNVELGADPSTFPPMK